MPMLQISIFTFYIIFNELYIYTIYNNIYMYMCVLCVYKSNKYNITQVVLATQLSWIDITLGYN